MGSLMSGWNSAALDPKTIKFRRNKSLTRDEIYAFWRAKKNEEEHNSGVGSPVAQENVGRVSQMKKFQRSESLPLSHTRESVVNNVSNKNKNIRSSGINSYASNNKENVSRVAAVKKFQRSESLPSNRRESMLDSVQNLDAGKHISRQRWWTTCSSSFLNETPLMAMDGPAYKYASQYQYTRFGSAK